MEAIGGHPHPGIKKTGKKKASRKGRAANRRDRDLKKDEATTSSEISKDTPEETSEIFYDATAEGMEIESLGYRYSVAAPSVDSPRSPKKDVNQTQSENSGVSETQQAPSARKSYWLKHYSHSTGHSIGIQTVDEDNINRRNQQSFISDDEHLLRSWDVYEDARETLTDHEFPSERGKDKRKKRQNTKKERENIQELGSEDTCNLKNENLDCYQRRKTDREAAAAAAGHRQETSCCWCLLTALFWLSVVMFILLLLTLFFVVFLLFSRNHGLGIGPSLIYSDVDLVRSAVNPSLDLRHNGPPPI